MIRKLTGGITTLLALAVTVVTAIVVAGYWQTANRSDRIMIMLPPITIPLVLAGIGLIATLSSARSGKKNGWMIGFCLGATLYLVFPALQLLLQYDMVRHDGTGFWAVIMLPSIYFGIPLPVIGALLGFVTGLFVDRKRRKEGVQQTKDSHGSR